MIAEWFKDEKINDVISDLRAHLSKLSGGDAQQSDMVAVPREVVEKIASAMTIAKETIKIWHDIGLKKHDPVFEFYERNSPEMKTINEAMSMLQPYTKGEGEL